MASGVAGYSKCVRAALESQRFGIDKIDPQIKSLSLDYMDIGYHYTQKTFKVVQGSPVYDYVENSMFTVNQITGATYQKAHQLYME